jgi:hypothetical protein
MNRIRAWLLAAVVGIAVGGGTFVWLVEDLLLAATLAFVNAVGAWLFIEYAATLPGMIHGDDWQTVRWNGAFTLVALVGALFGVSLTLPISNELRFALQWLVLSVGWTGMFFGVAMAREQAAADESTGETETTGETDRDLA